MSFILNICLISFNWIANLLVSVRARVDCKLRPSSIRQILDH